LGKRDYYCWKKKRENKDDGRQIDERERINMRYNKIGEYYMV
jgi:hypothetical protein